MSYNRLQLLAQKFGLLLIFDYLLFLLIYCFSKGIFEVIKLFFGQLDPVLRSLHLALDNLVFSRQGVKNVLNLGL
jgi:hypothetical protein